tara:strand:- start:53 stop:232 length:180 start_codon:yes stop_codon:yes gene_type:complete
MNLAGFFFITDKTAKELDFKLFKEFSLSKFIPPRGIKFNFTILQKLLNLIIPKKVFLFL